MHFGIWTPLPHTIRPEPRMERALAEIKAVPNLEGKRDGTFEHACDVVRRADNLGSRAQITSNANPRSRARRSAPS